ncbi:helix-turn-helix transcriptional regulator [Diaphorobacter sp. HDW4B]|uniref:helix-turn-helix transcriptional regulator n=1 Tax=Diaphorobacter sp. HDW4B TaxID=2714925 RepID=UPI001F0F53B9|nr:helix-turn-helix transcriptional regulator [Diaphorobacter sp. HDW4B]
MVENSVDNQGAFGLNAEKMREYEQHHASSDMRIRILMSLPTGQVMLDHERISAREMSRDVVYSDILWPNGFGSTLGTMLRDDSGSRDFMGFMRPSDHTHYGADEKLFIEHLMPTLVRASRIRARMNALSRQASLGISALETLVQGVAVVDAQCRIHYANPAAERLMTPPSAVSVVHRRLRCADAELQTRLEQLATQACGNPGRAGAVDTSLSSTRAARLVVTVLPLKSSHLLASSWQKPLALVILTIPGAVSALDHRLVSDMLGLSPTEARLLLLLAAGKSVKDFALVEGCSWHTGRAHMKNLMRKTGCHRQVELVQLLQALQVE